MTVLLFRNGWFVFIGRNNINVRAHCLHQCWWIFCLFSWRKIAKSIDTYTHRMVLKKSEITFLWNYQPLIVITLFENINWYVAGKKIPIEIHCIQFFIRPFWLSSISSMRMSPNRFDCTSQGNYKPSLIGHYEFVWQRFVKHFRSFFHYHSFQFVIFLLVCCCCCWWCWSNSFIYRTKQ